MKNWIKKCIIRLLDQSPDIKLESESDLYNYYKVMGSYKSKEVHSPEKVYKELLSSMLSETIKSEVPKFPNKLEQINI